MKTYNGIDVSRWQGDIDHAQVKAAGIDFAIIKAGGSDMGLYKDSRFEENYAGFKAAGIACGAYYFTGPLFYGSYAGLKDAERFTEILKGKQFEYPVFVDIEMTQASRANEATEAAVAFCEYMENAGYFVGIYASSIAGFKECLHHNMLTAYAHWVADYTWPVDFCDDYQIHQYTNKGVVSGIVPYVDLDISTVNYTSIMKKKGLNGFKKGEKK